MYYIRTKIVHGFTYYWNPKYKRWEGLRSNVRRGSYKIKINKSVTK